MRQVPQYLLIGNGRVARHFQHYFSLLKLPFTTWHRRESHDKLRLFLSHASHILLLISDDAIEGFIAEHIKNSNSLCIHFSGSLISDHAYGAHPLTTFSEDLYDTDQYHAIPFILDEDAPAFELLLPGLPNQHARLPKSLKAKYHALCVLSGNFSCMLWQKLFSVFETEFHFPPSIAFPYLLQQTKNLISNNKTALTGPLVRNDVNTIEKNIAALHFDPFQEIYKSFISCYQQTKR